MATTISGEGKLGLALGLIALGGAGALGVWPTHQEIGWILIAIAIVGGAALTAHHFKERLTRDRRGRLIQKIGAVTVLILILGAVFGAAFMATTRVPSVDPQKTVPSAKPLIQVFKNSDLDTRFRPNPVFSTWEKLVFSCILRPTDNRDNVPPEEYQRQFLTYKNSAEGWGAAIGIDFSFSAINGGFKLVLDAKTEEAKAKMWRITHTWFTKVTFEFRRVGESIIVNAMLEWPDYIRKPTPGSAVFMDDWYSIRGWESTIEKIVGVPEGGCRII
jgi:hypothetical protein